MRLPDDERLRNHVGTQHAAGLFAAAEAASGGAFVAGFADRLAEIRPLAASAEISYTKLAKGPIDARAELPGTEGLLATLDARGQGLVPGRGDAHRRRRADGRDRDRAVARAAERVSDRSTFFLRPRLARTRTSPPSGSPRVFDEAGAEQPEWQPILLGGLFTRFGRGSWGRGPTARRACARSSAAPRPTGCRRSAGPTRGPGNMLTAMRAATFAKEIGRTVSFSLAAFRQAFAAGRDLTEPDNVFIAAASSELHPRSLRDGGRPRRDQAAAARGDRPRRRPRRHRGAGGGRRRRGLLGRRPARGRGRARRRRSRASSYVAVGWLRKR